MNLGLVPYREAWELQRSLAGAVSQGAIPDTILLLEHPPTVTTGRRTQEGELHIPERAEVEIVETDRGGKSTFHGPGQLVCYPIFDLKRHGQDVKRYCRDLEEALVQTLAAFSLDGQRIDGFTGVWLHPPPRKIASIGIHISRWVTTHGYALNVDLDPAPRVVGGHAERDGRVSVDVADLVGRLPRADRRAAPGVEGDGDRRHLRAPVGAHGGQDPAVVLDQEGARLVEIHGGTLRRRRAARR